MTKVNEQFPEFDLEYYDPITKNTGRITNKTLAKKWAVLLFYPADFTYVCPTELADLAKRYKEFQTLGCEVYVVSTDTVFTHKAWVEQEHLLKDVKYKLIADHNGDLVKKLDIYEEATGMAQRGVYIISPEGLLKSLQVVDGNVGRSAGEVLRQVKALQYVAAHPGMACPASWDMDGKALKKDIKIAGNVYKELQ